MKPHERVRLLALAKKFKAASEKYENKSRKLYAKEKTGRNDEDWQWCYQLQGRSDSLAEAAFYLNELIKKFDEADK